MVELTIPYETGIEDAASRKRSKHTELVGRCTRNGFAATLTTVEVGSRGFIHAPSFNNYTRLWMPAQRQGVNWSERSSAKSLRDHLSYGASGTGL